MKFFIQFSSVSEISRSLILLLISTLLCFDALAQPEDKYKKLLEWHDQEIGIRSLGIINGPVYTFNRISKTSHAFFNNHYWENGMIRINGQTFSDLSLVYDLEIDLIVVKHPDPMYNMGISVRNVEYFSIYGRNFKWLEEISELKKGYYEESFLGKKLNVYIRREKEPKVQDGTVEYILKTYIYLEVDGSVTRFKGMKQLYKAFPQQEADLRSVRREYHLRPSEKRIDHLQKLLQIMGDEL